MDFETYSFRHADVIFKEPEFIDQYNEIITVIKQISEEELIAKHSSYGTTNIEKTPMSLSKALNKILKDKFKAAGWFKESVIFQDKDYQGETWRLDFAKQNVSIEVGFNHSSVIAWNLLKPVLASELNHVQKAIQTKIGVIIAVTEEMKKEGGFDKAIGTYEKYLEYLPPLNNLLTVPLLIIGLKAPSTFSIRKIQHAERKKIGEILKK